MEAAATTTHPPQYHTGTSVSTPISSLQVKPTITSSLIHPPPPQEGFVPAPELQEPPLSLIWAQVHWNFANDVRRHTLPKRFPRPTLPKRFLSATFLKQELPPTFPCRSWCATLPKRFLSPTLSKQQTSPTFLFRSTCATFPKRRLCTTFP